MTEHAEGRRTLPSQTALIASGLVILGVLLWMFVSKGLLFVAGFGAFGPGIVRELGLLRDQDEFQREAARRAGYHAYLVGGFATILAASALQLPQLSGEEAAEWVSVVLVVLWMTWLFSSLMEFWGARKTAARVLVTFGSFWAIFVLADLVGSAAMPNSARELLLGLLGLLVGIGVVAPFFGLAWSAGRWPRATGAALLAVALIFVAVFFRHRGQFQMSTNLMTGLLLLGPLVACGVALLRDRPETS